MLYILTRKAGIAACGLIFRTNPGFMLAGVLLILFVCYMVQVKHQPYMSTSQRALVLAEHKIKVASGDKLHMGIGMSITKAMRGEGNARDLARARKVKVQFSANSIAIGGLESKRSLKKMTGDDKERALKVHKKHKVLKKQKIKESRQFFFDYNTVEQILLACAILVCVAGVMFESDRFQSTDASGKLRYGWMRDFVTFCIVFVVISSLIYLVVVSMSEIIGYTPKFVQKLCANRKNHALLSAASTIQDQEDNQIEMNFVNPAASASQVADAKEMIILQKKLAEQEQVNADLAAARMKQARAAAGTKSKDKKGKGKGKGKGRGKKKKNDFGAKKAYFDINGEAEAPSKEDKGDVNELIMSVNPAAKGHKSRPSWKQVNDPGSGKDYYHNVLSNQVSWEKPADDLIIQSTDAE